MCFDYWYRTLVALAPLVGGPSSAEFVCASEYLCDYFPCFSFPLSHAWLQLPISWRAHGCSRPHMSGLGRSSSHQITLPRSSSSNIDASLCCQAGTFCLQLPRQDLSWARIKSSCFWGLGDPWLWMQFLCPWLVLFPVSLVVLGVGRTPGNLRLPRQGPVTVPFSLFLSPVLGLCVCRCALQSL